MKFYVTALVSWVEVIKVPGRVKRQLLVSCFPRVIVFFLKIMTKAFSLTSACSFNKPNQTWTRGEADQIKDTYIWKSTYNWCHPIDRGSRSEKSHTCCFIFTIFCCYIWRSISLISRSKRANRAEHIWVYGKCTVWMNANSSQVKLT